MFMFSFVFTLTFVLSPEGIVLYRLSGPKSRPLGRVPGLTEQPVVG